MDFPSSTGKNQEAAFQWFFYIILLLFLFCCLEPAGILTSLDLLYEYIIKNYQFHGRKKGVLRVLYRTIKACRYHRKSILHLQSRVLYIKKYVQLPKKGSRDSVKHVHESRNTISTQNRVLCIIKDYQFPQKRVLEFCKKHY